MLVLGADEVGRGSIAGPLVVGAVALDTKINGLKDSKLLARKQRTLLNAVILKQAAYCGVGWVEVSELDQLGLTKALTLAFSRAVAKLNLIPDRIVLDGKFNYLAGYPSSEVIIQADKLIPAVSAASIVAKVARDNYMIELAKQFPDYGFERHVGYCTSGHLNALSVLGPCAHHRKSFEPIKSLLASKSNTF